MDMEQLLSRNTESSSSGTPDTGLVLLLLYPELESSSSGALWSLRAHHTAALLGAHTAEQIIQWASTSATQEHMHRAAASSEHTEQLCWSTWSSCSLGADTGAPLQKCSDTERQPEKGRLTRTIKGQRSPGKSSPAEGPFSGGC